MNLEEITKIQKEAKELRGKNKEIEEKNKNLFNENLRLIKEINKIRGEIKDLGEKKKDLNNEISGLINDRNAQLAEITEQMSGLQNEKVDLLSLKEKTDASLSELKEGQEKLAKDKADFKKFCVKTENTKKEAVTAKFAYDTKVKELEDLEKEKIETISSLNNKSAGLDEKYSELDLLKIKTKEALDVQLQKNEELSNEINAHKDLKASLLSRITALDNAKNEQEKITEDLKKAIKEAEKSKYSHDALLSNLYIRDKEVKIRELKVLEAERRVGIENELKELIND